MQVNQPNNSYTVSLFQTAQVNNPAARSGVAPGPASVFSPGINTDMTGVYLDPRVALIAPATLSQKTQDILSTIQALISNELQAIGATFREMAGVDLELEPDEALPKATQIIDLEPGQNRLLSDQTKDAGWSEMKFSLNAKLASVTAEQLSGTRAFIFGEQYVGMSEEELVDVRLNAMVDSQMAAIKTTLDMARSDEFQRYAANGEMPTTVGAPLSEADFETMRADLLAKRQDEYRRGELRLQVEVFSSFHAANYEKSYATLDTDGAGLIVRPENGAAFDTAWTMSDQDKETFGRMFDGIAVVDGELVLDPEKDMASYERGLDFLEKYGDIGLEYLRDARS